MPSRLTALSVALGLFVVALGLISAGTDRDVDALWVAGLVLLAVGGLAGPVLRFAGGDGEDGGDG